MLPFHHLQWANTRLSTGILSMIVLHDKQNVNIERTSIRNNPHDIKGRLFDSPKPQMTR